MNRRDFVKFAALGAVTALGSNTLVNAANLPKPKKSEKFDVVVIGAGFSGLMTACAAAEAGAKVAVVEKAPFERTGGLSRLTGGTFIFPASESERDVKLFYDAVMAKSLNRGNGEICMAMSRNIIPGIKWLRKIGVEYTDPMPQPGLVGKTSAFLPSAYRGGPVVLKKLREVLAGMGGKVFHDTRVRQLVFDDNGVVCGARAMTPDGMKDFLGERVVIAAGGYPGNKELLEAFIDPDADMMLVRGDINATGDGLMLAKEAGAAWVNMGGLQSIHIAAVSPSNPSAGNPFKSVIYCLGINQDGKRYVDESLGYVSHGKASMKQPGQKVALVFDENVYKQNGIQFGVKLFEDIKLPLVEAHSLEELAKKINVPANELKKTIDEFNKAVEPGNKAPKAIPPKSEFAYKLDAPKYYAFYPMVPGITLTFGGIKVDKSGKALEADGTPVPGLYAVGEGAGGSYYHDYIGGASISNCISSAYRVGTTIFKK